MLSVAIGIAVTINKHRLKLKEEERLASSSRAAVDVQLIKAFTEVMDLAMGRRQHVLSEKAMEELFRIGVLSKEDFTAKDGDIERKLSHYSVVILPTGGAGQTAAIAAIAMMAERYEFLMNPAIEGLSVIHGRHGPHANVAEYYLKRLRGH